MKKLLILLSSFAVFLGSSLTTISCGLNNNYVSSPALQINSIREINRNSLDKINFKIGTKGANGLSTLISTMLESFLGGSLDSNLVGFISANAKAFLMANETLNQLATINGMNWITYKLQKQFSWLRFTDFNQDEDVFDTLNGLASTAWIPTVNDWALSVTFLQDDFTYWSADTDLAYMRINIIGRVEYDNEKVILDSSKTNLAAVRFDENGQTGANLIVDDPTYGQISNGWMGGTLPIDIRNSFDENYGEVSSAFFEYMPSVSDFNNFSINSNINDLLKLAIAQNSIYDFILDELKNNPSYLSDYINISENTNRLKIPVATGIMYSLMIRRTSEGLAGGFDENNLFAYDNLYTLIIFSLKSAVSKSTLPKLIKEEITKNLELIANVGSDGDSTTAIEAKQLITSFKTRMMTFYNLYRADLIGNSLFVTDIRTIKFDTSDELLNENLTYGKKPINFDIEMGEIGISATEQLQLHIYQRKDSETAVDAPENENLGYWFIPDQKDSSMLLDNKISWSDYYFRNISNSLRMNYYAQFQSDYNILNNVWSISTGITDITQGSLFDWNSVDKYDDNDPNWWYGTDIENILGQDTTKWSADKVSQRIDSVVRSIFAQFYDIKNVISKNKNLWNYGMSINDIDKKYDPNNPSLNPTDIYVNNDDLSYSSVYIENNGGVTANIYATDRTRSSSTSRATNHIVKWGLNNYGDRNGNNKPPDPTKTQDQVYNYTIMARQVYANGSVNKDDVIDYNNWVLNPDSQKWLNGILHFYIQYQVYSKNPSDPSDPNYKSFNGLYELWHSIVKSKF
ncbi:hypothetical protein [Spiroplasma endosymbiont of Labia minor]|uniref:hypothetical protein n=1 Tax=Spiroplasma endosymbiont of Labia minor TaxID=3066305 RepID=UPI0030CAF942